MSIDSKLLENSWIRIALQKFAEELKITGKVIHHGLFNAFEDYTKRIYQKSSVFRSIVFKNEQKKLSEYYLPLTLEDAQHHQYVIDEYPAELIFQVKKAVIIDTAGMGKSTLMRYMYLSACDKKVGLPIFFELRRLIDLDKEGFLDALLNDFAGLGKVADRDLMLDLLREGEFIFLLDGFDEIPDSQKPKAIETLNEFISRAPRNLFIISSRDEPSIANFADFKKFAIRPLTKIESNNLIRKYAEDQEKANTLIELLEQPENGSAKEFLTNPLLVSLLYRSYEYKNKIPLRKHLFYEQVFNSLFEEHDLSKDGKPLDREKRSKLTLDRFHKVMRSLGYLTYFREKKLQYEVGQIKKIIDDCRNLSGEQNFEASDFLTDLEQKVPLLTREGVDVRWTHKSIQEYFAADFIFKDHPNKSKVWSSFLAPENSSGNLNFLTLYRDIDEKGFRQILLKLLNEMIIQQYEDFRAAFNNKGFTEDEVREYFEYSFDSKRLLYMDDIETEVPEVGALPSPHNEQLEIEEVDGNVTRKYIDSMQAVLLANNDNMGSSSFLLSNPSVVTPSDMHAATIRFILKSYPELFKDQERAGPLSEETITKSKNFKSFLLQPNNLNDHRNFDRAYLSFSLNAFRSLNATRIDIKNIINANETIRKELELQKALLTF